MKALILSLITSLVSVHVLAADKPNIIVLVADDLGYADVGYHGFPAAKEVLTPNIDRLAASGTVFRQGYVAFSTCGPSRASLLTGRSASRFGIEDNDQPLSKDEILLPKLLKPRGYVSAAIGKWHLGIDKGIDALERGFDFRYGNDSGSGDYFMAKTELPPCWKNGTERPRAYGNYITDAYVDEAAQFIKRSKSQPFFLYLGFNAPHSPFRVYQQQVEKLVAQRPHWQPVYERMKAQGKFPAYDFGKFKGKDLDQDILRLCYLTMLMNADEGIGKVLATLDSEGLREKTLVYFLSDNGAALHRPNDLGGVNLPLREGKGTCFEGGVRVPYIMSWPGTITAGRNSDLLVSSMDIFSTAIGLAGGKIPKDRVIDGVNVMPHLDSADPYAAHQSLFFRRKVRDDWAIRVGNLKLIVDSEKIDAPQGHLFDLKNDRSETQDISSQQQAEKKELRDIFLTKINPELRDPPKGGKSKKNDE